MLFLFKMATISIHLPIFGRRGFSSIKHKNKNLGYCCNAVDNLHLQILQAEEHHRENNLKCRIYSLKNKRTLIKIISTKVDTSTILSTPCILFI